MTTYTPQVALALQTPGWNLASSQWGWGFHTELGGIHPGVHHVRPRFVGLYIHMEGFMMRGWNTLSSPGRASPTNPRLRFSNEPEPHRAGRCRPGEPLVSSPVCWSCKYMEGLWCCGCDLILPRWRWIYNPRLGFSKLQVQLGFPHRAGLYQPGRPPFSSPVCWSCTCMEGFMMRGWDLILPGWHWITNPRLMCSN